MANQSGGGGGSSIPTPVSTANGGTGANNSAATGFQQYNSGVGSVAPLSAADMPTGIDATKLADGSVTNAELQYIGTLTSNAQTQISARLPLAGGTMTGDLIIPAANLKPSGSGGTGHLLRQTSSGGAISSGALTPSDMPVPSKTRASRITSDQGSLSGTYAPNTVLFNNLDVNENSAWSLSSGILTCGSALPGRWLIICNITLTGQYELLTGLWKGSNCIAQAYLNCTAVTANYQILSIVEDFANGDTLKATVALNTATSAVVARAASQATNGYSTWIECIYLGRSS